MWERLTIQSRLETMQMSLVPSEKPSVTESGLRLAKMYGRKSSGLQALCRASQVARAAGRWPHAGPCIDPLTEPVAWSKTSINDRILVYRFRS